MLRRLLKWFGFALLGAAALAAAVAAVGVQLAERKAQRQVAVTVAAVAYRDDAASLERGRYLYASRGCADCHGADGSGRVFIDDGSMKVAGPAISPGPGSVTANYQGADWDRIIRHGVKGDGRPAFIMPSEDYNRFTDADLAALVAYLRQMPAVQGKPAVIQLPLPVRVLYGLGAITDAAEKIDHRLAPSLPVAEGVTREHGKYVANACIGCHGAGLSGGKIPGTPPSWPDAANLTPGAGTVMGRYADASVFAKMMKTGKRPDGSVIAVMPFESLAQLSDVDLAAVHMYLQGVPARAAGQR